MPSVATKSKYGKMSKSYILTSVIHLSKYHLRRCKTAITWLRSLSAILPLFWRHDIAELHHLCREDSRNVLWRHEICDVFPRIMTCALQNIQFSQYFTMKFNIFSLNLTGESDFLFYLLVHTTKFLWVVFNKIWMIRFFAVVNYMVRNFSFCSNLCADVIANIILLHIFINLKIVFNSWNMILKLKSFIQIGTYIIHMKRLNIACGY